jgi:hypothetical protein
MKIKIAHNELYFSSLTHTQVIYNSVDRIFFTIAVELNLPAADIIKRIVNALDVPLIIYSIAHCRIKVLMLFQMKKCCRNFVK